MRAAYVCSLVLFLACPAGAQWASVGEGIDYATWTLPDPNRVFVTRMDRSNPNLLIESSIGQGKLVTGRETVRSMGTRYDQTINYWGQTWGNRNQVVVGINGDFFNTTTGYPTSGQIQSSWYCKRWGELTGSSGFAWRLNGDAFIGPCVKHFRDQQVIRYMSTGTVQEIGGTNMDRASNTLTIYTPHYNDTTLTDASGSEVVVQLSRPLLLVNQPNYVSGTVVQVRANQGSSPIPFDCIVLSATGNAASTMLAGSTVGTEVRISQLISNYNTDCNTPLGGFDWTKAYAGVGTNFTFLKDGVIQSTTNAGLINLAPRTAIAYNSSYIFFFVVDGRDTTGPDLSAGMNMTQVATFCRDTLGATHGANLDGGGSSTMVVNGAVKNQPSDGSERTVANGLMMVVSQPLAKTLAFQTAQNVRTTGSANLRLGPGTNYGLIATLAANADGVVVDHAMNGVLAKGFNWWKCQFAGGTGWVAESLLAPVSFTPPVVTQDPLSLTVLYGRPAAFQVTASGSGLSYQWQKGTTNLIEGGRLTGTSSANLSISACIATDAGSYRCVVTNPSGSDTSAPATLTILPPGDFDHDGDVDQTDFAHLQECLSGTFVAQTDPLCQDTLLDDDTDVDQQDFAIFSDCLSGAGIAANPACATP